MTTSPFSPMGQSIPVATSNPSHFADFDLTKRDLSNMRVGHGDTFYDKMMGAVNLVNDNIIHSDKIGEQFITKPNTVDVHDVTVALQKAQMSIDLSRAIIQRSISSYQTIVNLR